MSKAARIIMFFGETGIRGSKKRNREEGIKERRGCIGIKLEEGDANLSLDYFELILVSVL